MLLPIYAQLERGYYYVVEPLHTYVMRPSLENTGEIGQMAAAKNEQHKKQLTEINNFYVAASYAAAAKRLIETGDMAKLPPGAVMALFDKVLFAAGSWAWSRERLTMEPKEKSHQAGLSITFTGTPAARAAYAKRAASSSSQPPTAIAAPAKSFGCQTLPACP